MFKSAISFLYQHWEPITIMVSFILSIYNVWIASWRRVRLSFIPESQIQLIIGRNQTMGASATTSISVFNLFYNITATGSDIKWSTFKFEKAKMTTPTGEVSFKVSIYLDEVADSTRNSPRQLVRCRPLPIAIKGGDSHFVTPAFASNNMESWVVGDYRLVVFVNHKNKEIKLKELLFSLDDLQVRNINSGIGTHMIPVRMSDLFIFRMLKWRGL